MLLQATCYLNYYKQITVKSIKFYTVKLGLMLSGRFIREQGDGVVKSNGTAVV